MSRTYFQISENKPVFSLQCCVPEGPYFSSASDVSTEKPLGRYTEFGRLNLGMRKSIKLDGKLTSGH